MYQIVEQTFEEKFFMYSKLKKNELITMLIEANRHLSNIKPTVAYCHWYVAGNDTSARCINCGKEKHMH